MNKLTKQEVRSHYLERAIDHPVSTLFLLPVLWLISVYGNDMAYLPAVERTLLIVGSWSLFSIALADVATYLFLRKHK